jgi:hypothetical protein
VERSLCSALKEDAVEMGLEPHEVSRRGEIVREGKYVAEVDVELLENETGWSPYLSLDDAYKLEDVREALRRGDITAAS